MKDWMTIDEMKAVDFTDAALCVNKSTRSGDLIIARPTRDGKYAVLAARGRLVSMLMVMVEKFHAINWARKCAAQGWR